MIHRSCHTTNCCATFLVVCHQYIFCFRCDMPQFNFSLNDIHDYPVTCPLLHDQLLTNSSRWVTWHAKQDEAASFVCHMTHSDLLLRGTLDCLVTRRRDTNPYCVTLPIPPRHALSRRRSDLKYLDLQIRPFSCLFFEVTGNPVYSHDIFLKFWGLSWKLVRNDGSHKYFKSDLLRPWFRDRPTQSIMYVPLQVNRFQKSILVIVQYKFLKSCSGDFNSPESDPPHKIMRYWFYYSI